MEDSLPKSASLRTATVLELPPNEAIGYAAAEFIVPYPPGIPLLVPGERIDRATVESLERQQRNGVDIHGLNGNLIRVAI
jgi:arginine/lysine/ornithine decarboxylase